MPSDKSSAINYKKLERWNNYINGLTVILIFLSISAIPATFFSLQATRNDDTTLIIQKAQLEGVCIRGFASTDLNPNNMTYSFTISKPKQGFLISERTIERNSSYITKLNFELLLGSKKFFSDFPEITAFKAAYQTNIHANVTKVRLELDLSSDTSVELQNSVYSIDFSSFIYEIFYSAPVRTSYSAGVLCTDTFSNCVPTFSNNVFITRNGDVEITSIVSTGTQALIAGKDGFPAIVAGRGVILYSGTAAQLPTLQTIAFEEVPKYSSGDTAIDSLAISGIIVSIMLLLVTLTKIVLYVLFTRR